MKRNVRFISMLTAALLLLSSCTSTSEPSTSLSTESTDTNVETVDTADTEEDVTDETKGEAGIFIPGTYTGTAEGHGGPLEVAVTVDENTIQSVEVTKQTETKGIGDVAIEKVTAAILTNQNVEVDAVAGCTISANAVRLAATDALEQATDGDLSKLKSTELKEASADPISMETDVVVVGSGAAGLCAAITAAQNGAKVIILEKLPRTGGSTRTSSGMVVASGTTVQAEGGIEDSIEDLKAYWLERGEGNVDEDIVNYAAEHAADSLQFLMDNGVTYLPDGITSSGTTDVLRAHVPPGNGVEFVDCLVESAEELGVEIILETEATKLITDESGAVVGVEADQNGAAVTVSAKAVVIATGGYDQSDEMKAEYAPESVGTWPVSSPGNTGDGINMGIEVGADTVFKGSMLGWKVISPAYGHTSSIGGLVYQTPLVVDITGSRFVNEGLDYPYIYTAMTRNGSDQFYYIFDASYKNPEQLETAVELGMAYKADSFEELEELVGLPNLAETVSRYNELAANGEDEDFGKDASLMSALETGPFYAVKAMPATLGSFGGLKVSIPGNVLNTEGEAIPGLYAAGEVANGDFFGDYYPASGSSLSMCVTFGIEAGKSAAQYAAE